MKRLLSLLIALCLTALTVFPVCAQENFTPCEMAVDGLNGVTTVSGLYRDNIFYIHPTELCAILLGVQMESTGNRESAAFSTNTGMRQFAIRFPTAQEDGVLLTEHVGDKAYAVNVPCVQVDNQGYVSLLHFLNYIGIPYVLSPDAPQAQLHLAPSYTVQDALFSLYDAALDTPFQWEDVGYDSQEMLQLLIDASILPLLLKEPGWTLSVFFQEQSMNLYAKDALLQILKTSGTKERSFDLKKKTKQEYEVTLEITIRLLTDGGRDEALAKQLKAYKNVAKDTTDAFADTLSLLNKYVLVNQADQEMLALTLCGPYAEYSATLQGNEAFLRIAEDLQENIGSEFSAVMAFVTEDVLPDLLAGLGKSALGGAGSVVKTVSDALENAELAVDVMEMADAGVMKKLEQEGLLLTFGIANEVARAAQDIRLTAEQVLYDPAWATASDTDREETMRILRAAIRLQLKAAIVAYEMLRDSGVLGQEYAAWLQQTLAQLDIQLSDLPYAELRWPMYPYTAYEDDLSWLAAPAVSCNGILLQKKQVTGNAFLTPFDVNGDGVQDSLFYDQYADTSYWYLQFMPGDAEADSGHDAEEYLDSYPHCFPDRQYYTKQGYQLLPEYENDRAALYNGSFAALHTGRDGRLYLVWGTSYPQVYCLEGGSMEMTWLPMDLRAMLNPPEDGDLYTLQEIDCVYAAELAQWCLVFTMWDDYGSGSRYSVCVTFDQGEAVVLARCQDGVPLD